MTIGACVTVLAASLASALLGDVNAQEVRRVTLVASAPLSIGDTGYINALGSAGLRSGGIAVTRGWAAAMTTAMPPHACNIVIFDSAAHLQRAIGRSGKGPGECLELSTIGARGDSVWMLDGRLRRITMFAPNGTVARSVRSPGGNAMLLSDGTIAEWRHAERAGPDQPLRIARFNGKGDSIGTLTVGTTHRREMHLVVPRGAYATDQPWDDTPLVSVCPDGSCFVVVDRTIDAKSPHYTVARFALNGTVTSRSAIPYAPSPVTDADVDSLLAPFWTSPQLSEDQRRELRRNYVRELWRPPHKLPVTQLLIAVDGAVWLATDRSGDQRKWVVLSASGKVDFAVMLPARFDVRAVIGQSIWGVEHDEEKDTKKLIRYRIESKGR